MALQDQEHPPSPLGKSRRSFLGALLGLAAVSVGALFRRRGVLASVFIRDAGIPVLLHGRQLAAIEIRDQFAGRERAAREQEQE